jgi:hypothetical protein
MPHSLGQQGRVVPANNRYRAGEALQSALRKKSRIDRATTRPTAEGSALYITLSHTTYQYHSKRINKTPNTGIIPVNPQ